MEWLVQEISIWRAVPLEHWPLCPATLQSLGGRRPLAMSQLIPQPSEGLLSFGFGVFFFAAFTLPSDL